MGCVATQNQGNTAGVNVWKVGEQRYVVAVGMVEKMDNGEFKTVKTLEQMRTEADAQGVSLDGKPKL